MNRDRLVLKKEEQVAFAMRELFERNGYRRFEMSKFEEYDFYAENRSFLSSENILTYTGLDGKLLALKPDVTLSIVKNTKGSYGSPDRVYYNENVYRARKGDKEYREIMQAGLEYIGDVDVYATLEVLLLAQKSLSFIDGSYIMDLSHMGFVGGLIEETGLGSAGRKRLLKAIREKNLHEIRQSCAEWKVDEGLAGRLIRLASAYGGLRETLCEIAPLSVNGRTEQALSELREICRCLEECGQADRVRLDFSIVNDMDYYNGITFQGFIEGIPSGVLSGGRYDHLVHKLGKQADAIGFAVYLDLLERFRVEKKEYDTDVLLLYREGTDPVTVAAAAARLTEGGESVTVRRLAESGESVTVRRLAESGEAGDDRKAETSDGAAEELRALYADIRCRRIQVIGDREAKE